MANESIRLTAEGYLDAVECMSVGFPPPTRHPDPGSGGAGSGKIIPLDINITRAMDGNSPGILDAASTGKSFQTGSIDFYRSSDGSGVPYFSADIAMGMFASYNLGGPGPDGGVPIEHFTISCNILKYDVRMKPDPS